MKILSLFFVALFAISASSQELKEKDLKLLEGGTWVGQLTYLDYRSNKPVTIKSNVSITRKPDAAGTWVFAYAYPDEPKADGSSDVVLAVDGKTFNGQTFVEKRKISNGGIEIVTTKEGDDNNKKALFRYTYTITPKTFSIRKDVQYADSAEWFERNTYSWAR